MSFLMPSAMKFIRKAAAVARDPDPGRRMILVLNKTPLRHGMKAYMDLRKRPLRDDRLAVLQRNPASAEERAAAARLRDEGHCRMDGLLDPAALRAVAESVDKKVDGATRAPKAGQVKSFWVNLSDDELTGRSLSTSHPLLQLGLQESALRVAGEFLGSAAFLDYVLVTQSVPSEGELKVSQLWHLDRDDVRMVKLFVYLSDVDRVEQGPFTFFDAKDSAGIDGSFVMEHLKDEKVFSQVPAEKRVEVKGPKLTAFMVDTSRCYHMGSRVAPGHSRLMFTALYVGLPSAYPWGGKSRYSLEGDLSELQRWATHPEGKPQGKMQ